MSDADSYHWTDDESQEKKEGENGVDESLHKSKNLKKEKNVWLETR